MTVSGQFTFDGSGTGGAIVTVIDTDADPSTVVGTATTASDGTWSVDGGADTTVENIIEYQDGSGNQYYLVNTPFVDHTPTPTYIQNKGVMWLKTGEGSGSTTADTLNGHDGTITGAFWVSGTWVDGWALEYDGNDDITTVPHNSALNVASGDFAIAATVDLNDPTTTASFRGIMMKYPVGGAITEHYGLYHDSGNWTLRIRDANGNAINPSYAISNTTMPARIVAVRDGDTGRLYVNGTEVASQTTAIGSPDNTNDLHIGRYWTTNAIDGRIDDVIVFNNLLTDAEITEDYNRQPWS